MSPGAFVVERAFGLEIVERVPAAPPFAEEHAVQQPRAVFEQFAARPKPPAEGAAPPAPAKAVTASSTKKTPAKAVAAK